LTLFLAAGCHAGVATPKAVSVRALEDDPALISYVETRNYRLGHPVQPKATPDGKTVVYLQSGPRSDVRDLIALDVASGKTRILASSASLTAGPATLSREEAAERERKRVTAKGIVSYGLDEAGRTAIVPLSGKLYSVDVLSGAAHTLGGSGQTDPQPSPDGKWVASVIGGELCVQPIASGSPRPLTSGASALVTHGLAEFIAEEELDRFEGFWWSPDSSLLAFEEADASGVEPFTLVDAAHPEARPEPSPYPRPGKANVKVRLAVVSANGGPSRFVQWDQEAFPYLARVHWPRQSGSPLLLEVLSRDQKRLQLRRADVRTGTTSLLLEETDPAWINLTDDFRWLPDGTGFLWSSERGGYRQLELHDPAGHLVRVLTPPQLGLRQLVTLEVAEGRAVAAILEASSDPTSQALYRLTLSDGAILPLADGPSVFSATASGDGRWLVVRQEQIDAAPRTTLRLSSDGTVRAEIPSHAEPPPPLSVKLYTLPTAAGTLQGALILPRHATSGPLPVIDWVYGGPHAVTVQRSAQAFVLGQWLADQGFIVAKIDNRGTPYRGRDFERAIRGSFGEVPLHDQIAGLAELSRLRGSEEPQLDLQRTGAIGASFGGYLSALAVLKAPQHFAAAVAIAPVVDWLDYDTAYTERYLGLPQDNEAGYRESSLLTSVAGLSRPLLLIHGTADDNVHFAGTLRLTSAMLQAGIPPNLLSVPGATHLFADQTAQRVVWASAAAFLMDHLQR
jgi:dipeptidyl-peptidase-4